MEEETSVVPAEPSPSQAPAPAKRQRQDEKSEALKRELNKIIGEVSSEHIAALVALSNATGLRRVFSDGELMRTAMSFINNSLNVSVAARALYMHRNTMMYRLDKVKRLTGLNIKRFNDAMAFKILYRAFKNQEEDE